MSLRIDEFPLCRGQVYNAPDGLIWIALGEGRFVSRRRKSVLWKFHQIIRWTCSRR